MVDESASVGIANFNLMKSFLSQLVARLDIDSGNTRVGLAAFSSYVGTAINLNAHSTVARLQKAIRSLPKAGSHGINIGTALAYVRTRMLTSAAGDRSNALNVVAVFTAGRSYNVTASRVSIKFAELYMSPVEIEIIMTRETR